MDENLVVAQLVVVTWSKAARGGTAAQERARVPPGFRLPDDARPPFVQRVTCSEHSGFRPTYATPRSLAHCLDEIALRMTVEPDALKIGADPNRQPSAPPARRIHQGEWLRWKHSRSGNRWAHLVILNLAVMPRPPANLFAGSPTFTAETVEQW
ncbi:MAG TPA: hypothetical protein PLZ93_10695 [Nocardioides sp.]|uniref:hypothetical protein n=1 Tax=uncultured Nocardioides sp. TaxID=198441 RepID=UPI000EE27394|nr:hypothetical protein [uncultured Nocardioides sp.]HCB05003.1 hypothetical protein [Nocardioides sp.]HRD61177.1 hypothetical protein [Nocardioides sp.]HRI96074.1 hypothetical protein [Nocardioides sp.]HRK46491.1 hypothetical protein [Nocardioides sp.]